MQPWSGASWGFQFIPRIGMEVIVEFASVTWIFTWTVSGEAEGRVTYEWAEGGFFLFQHVELGGTRGLEIIGHEQKYGEPPSADIRSRYYGFSSGETLEYTYELSGDSLTIWSGERGSPAYYQGTFMDDDTLTGAWHYPGGGGYKTVSTRVPGS